MKRGLITLCLLIILAYSINCENSDTFVTIANTPPIIDDDITIWREIAPDNVSLTQISFDPNFDNYTCFYNFTFDNITYAGLSCDIEFEFNFTNYSIMVILDDGMNTTIKMVKFTFRQYLMNCTTHLNLTARIYDNGHIKLEWEQDPSDQAYSVYHTYNMTDPENSTNYFINFSTASRVTDIYDSYWIDTGATFGPEKYYTVSVIRNETGCMTDEIAAKIDLELVKTARSGYNFVTIPLVPGNDSILDVLNPVLGNITTVYYYNNLFKTYSDFRYVCFGGSCVAADNISQILPTRAYWVDVKENVTLPVAGILENKTDTNLTIVYNAIGFHMIKGDRSSGTVFWKMNSSLNAAYMFDNQNKIYNQFIFFCFLGSCVPFGDLSYLNEKAAYWISIRKDVGLKWPQN